MAITKKELQSKVDIVNQNIGVNFILNYDGKVGEYELLKNKTANITSLIYKGKIREVYSFLDGLLYSIKLNRDYKVIEDNELVKYLKNKNQMSIKVKKQAVDGYFSQHSRIFHVNIVNVDGNKLYCKVEAKSITPSGYTQGGSEYTSGLIVINLSHYTKLSDIDNLLFEIVKKVDAETKEAVASGKVKLRSEDILWITPETSKRLGWSNPKLLTTNVEVLFTRY